MKRKASILIQVVSTVVSLAIFVCAGWLWNRSVSVADYYYRLEPTPAGGRALKGFGSYRGAFVMGEIEESSPAQIEGASAYRHDVYPLMKGSMMRAVPDTKVGALGFGISRGELKLNLGMLGMFMPKRLYRAVYVPYYFLMLLALVQPVRLALRVRKARAANPAPALDRKIPSAEADPTFA